jgi:hypothetical protein
LQILVSIPICSIIREPRNTLLGRKPIPLLRDDTEYVDEEGINVALPDDGSARRSRRMIQNIPHIAHEGPQNSNTANASIINSKQMVKPAAGLVFGAILKSLIQDLNVCCAWPDTW